MNWLLLAEEAAEGTGTTPNNNMQWVTWVILAVVVVAFIAWFVFSNKKNKDRQKEYTEQLDAIRPGHKVKTAGGICGIVVEVCDDNTIIMETGSEASGKSYIKLDKESIYQTDAKGPTQIAREEAEAAKRAAKEAKNAPAAETEEAPEEVTPSEDAPAAEELPEVVETPDSSDVPEEK